MKINSLLESQTVSSAISNTTTSAPVFGRDDDKLEETTTSGCMGSVANPVGKVRSRGSIFSGINTSEKFPNSKQVKEAGIGSVTVDMPTKPQGSYHDQEMDFYNNEIDDLVIQADPEFKAWIQSAEEQLVASEYARKNTEHLAKVLSAQQVKKFGSKTFGQKLGNAVAGKTYAYYTPEIKAIMDGPVMTAGNIIARRNELANNIAYVKQTWNRMSKDDRQKWAASVGMSYEQLEHVVRTGEMPNQQVSKTDPEQKLSETPTLADIRRHAAPKSAQNQRTWDTLSPEEKAKAIQMGQAGAKSNTPVGETKKANTKTARKEFGKRPRAELSDKEKEQKKSESDKLWDMLQAHIAQAEKEKVNEVDPQNFDSDEDYYDAVEADDLDLDKFTGDWDIPDEIAVLTNQLRHTSSQYLRDQIKRKIARYEQIYYGDDLEEASTSQAQFRTMAAVANNPKFAKKVGIKQSVGKEFHSADRKQDYKDLPAKVDEEGKGLWANIHAKRERIKSGSGERMRKPGSKGAPTADALKKSATEGVAEGWDPDTTRLEQDVRDALENGDDYTAKQYAKMAPTPEAKKYLLNIIKQAMYIDDLGGETDWKGVAEGDPGYDKHSFIGKIRRSREADNKGWGQLGQQFAANSEEEYRKALRKGNRYYNMTRGDNKTPGGFPKTTVEQQGVAEGLADTQQKIVDTINKLENRLKHAKTGEQWDRINARIERLQAGLNRSKKGVAEGHADQQRKIFKKNGKPVGEVGIDRESSPGVGQWYMKCYASGDDLSGYDSYEEAVAELKHCLKQGVAEGPSEVIGLANFAMGGGIPGGQSPADVVDARGVVEGDDPYEPEAYDEFASDTYYDEQDIPEEKQRLDPKCWKGYKKQGTKLKGDTRVNNCVKVDEAEISEEMLAHELYKDLQIFKQGKDKTIGKKSKSKDISKKPEDRDIVVKEGTDMRADEILNEGKPGLWANIHAKRERIKSGSGERMRKPGSKGAPSAQDFKDAAKTEAANPAQQAAIAIAMKKKGQKPKNEGVDDREYNDEAGMFKNDLQTIQRVSNHLEKAIQDNENLPEWCQAKIAQAKGMVVNVMDYMISQHENGIVDTLEEEFDMIESIVESIAVRNNVNSEVVWEDLESLTDDELYVFAVTSEPINEDWQKVNKKDKTDGMSPKAVKAYRRENPGSKLKTAVTTKPSKLKKGSKASKRRKSYCSRSKGQMNMHNISCSKTPDKAICKARRRWNC